MGRRRGHQSASTWRSLQHQRGASGGCGLVQSRGGCGLWSMLCSIAVTQPLLLWCVIDTVVAVYMYIYVHDCGRFVFETGWFLRQVGCLLPCQSCFCSCVHVHDWLVVCYHADLATPTLQVPLCCPTRRGSCSPAQYTHPHTLCSVDTSEGVTA